MLTNLHYCGGKSEIKVADALVNRLLSKISSNDVELQVHGPRCHRHQATSLPPSRFVDWIVCEKCRAMSEQKAIQLLRGRSSGAPQVYSQVMPSGCGRQMHKPIAGQDPAPTPSEQLVRTPTPTAERRKEDKSAPIEAVALYGDTNVSPSLETCSICKGAMTKRLNRKC